MLGACGGSQGGVGGAESTVSWRDVCVAAAASTAPDVDGTSVRWRAEVVERQLVTAHEEAAQVFSAADGESARFTAAARAWLARWVYADPALLEFSHERWVLHHEVAISLLRQSAAANDHVAAARWAREAGGLSDAHERTAPCVAAVLRAQQ